MKSTSTLLLTPPLIPESGWGRYSLAVIDELKKRPIEVTVLAEGAGRADSLRPLKSVGDFFYNIRLVRKAARQADIVHAFESWPHGVYGYFAVLGTRKRLFINAVGTYSFAPLDSLFKRFILVRAYRRAREIFAISSYTAKRLQRAMSGLRVRVVHLGLNPLPVPSAQAVSVMRERLGRHHPIILTVGAIKHRKGQLDTLKAIELLKRAHTDILYVVVGSSDDERYVGELTRYAESNGLNEHLVIFDHASDQELAALYSVADVFVLTSNNKGPSFEGFGMVVVEAAAFGLPVVGSADTGIEDALKDGYNGYLSKQADPEDIAAKIGKLLAADREELGAKSREFASGFSWQRTVDGYMRYYSEA